MLGSVLRIEGAVEGFLFDVRQSVGVFLFGIAAAFPSLSHEWLWEALHALRIPHWLVATVRALYMDSSATVVWNGMQGEARCPSAQGSSRGALPLGCCGPWRTTPL